MSSNLPQKKCTSFLEKIKNFFKKIFFKEKTEINDHEDTHETQVEQHMMENENTSNFSESIKADVTGKVSQTKINREREEFLDNIEANPKMLYDFPIEKLERLEEYYHESISKYEAELENLTKNANV